MTLSCFLGEAVRVNERYLSRGGWIRHWIRRGERESFDSSIVSTLSLTTKGFVDAIIHPTHTAVMG